MPRLSVLFLCTGNSCRSQMAEAWASALHPGSIRAASAGVRPSAVDPRAVTAMAEAGIDISDRQSKDVSQMLGRDFDWVITLCDHARQSCPYFPGRVKRMHKGFADPPILAANAASEEQAMGHYRRVRDDIKAFVQGMPANLSEEPFPGPAGIIKAPQ